MKTLLTAVLCMLLCVPVFADQQTTVLAQPNGSAQGYVPYIDGSNDAALEKAANNILAAKAKELLKETGGQGSVSYEVKLNRPSVLGILLKAQNGSKAAYQAVNIDLTTGKELSLYDFFTNNDLLKNALGGSSDILFGEKGLYVRNARSVEYTHFVAYSDLMPAMRIGEAGRLVQIARLTQNAADKILTVPDGSLIALKLASNPSTGYRWEVKVPQGAQNKIQKVGSSFVLPHDEESRVGSPGSEIMVLTAQGAGAYKVTMEYKRPWERHSLNSFSFTLVVEE